MARNIMSPAQAQTSSATIGTKPPMPLNLSESNLEDHSID
jgi:hypothetical protein